MAPLFRRVSFAVAIWAGALCICAQTLPSTGSIYGTALDEQGAPLPGVEVKLLGAGERAPVQTDAQGEFRFLYISPGTYAVTLSLDGFATVENQGIVVALDRSTQLRVTMKLAAVKETVTVSGAPAIDPRKTVTGATFGEKELQSIPSARNIWATLWAVPGVVTNQVNVGGNTAVQAGPSSKGVTGATYNLDGADITLSGISPTFYNFDSFQEVQVVTGGSDVTLLNGGATFNMVTRRGTNAHPRLGPVLLRSQPLADGEHARGGQPRRPVHQPHERPPRLRRRGGWGGAFRPPLALGRLGQEPDRPPEARPARHGGPAGQRELHARELRCAAGRPARRVELPRALLPPRGPDPGRTGCGHQHGAGVRLQPDSAGPDLQDRRHAGLFLEPDGDGLLFLHGLRTNRDAGRGRRHAGLHRSEQRAPRKQHLFANPLDRPAGRGLRLEVLHDREPLARAQVRIRVPVRDDRSLVVAARGAGLW